MGRSQFLPDALPWAKIVSFSTIPIVLAGRVATRRFASTTCRFAGLATEWTAVGEFRLALPVLPVVRELTKVTICSILSSVTPMIVAEPFLSALRIFEQAAFLDRIDQGKLPIMKSVCFSLLAIGLLCSSGCYRNLTCKSCQQSSTAGVVQPNAAGNVTPASFGIADGIGNGIVGQGARGNGGMIPQLPPGYTQAMQGPAGPPTAAYAYPYYTNRGPRDFLMRNPPTIGR